MLISKLYIFKRISAQTNLAKIFNFCECILKCQLHKWWWLLN